MASRNNRLQTICGRTLFDSNDIKDQKDGEGVNPSSGTNFMKTFYVFTPNDHRFHGPIFALDHQSCLLYAGYCSTDVLSKDIERWRDNAVHLDKFTLGNGWILICFEIDKITKGSNVNI